LTIKCQSKERHRESHVKGILWRPLPVMMNSANLTTSLFYTGPSLLSFLFIELYAV
jgi:hypothetical protein